MTDARLPERWLSDRRLLRLSDSAFRLHITTLMWTVTNRTDGQVDRDDLALIPRADNADVDQLVRAGLWQSTGSGWLLTEWDVTQTSRDELDLLTGMRRRAKLKKQRQRAKAKDQEGTVSPGQSPVTVPGDRPPVPERQGKASASARRTKGIGPTDEDEEPEHEPPKMPSVGASLEPTPDPASDGVVKPKAKTDPASDEVINPSIHSSSSAPKSGAPEPALSDPAQPERLPKHVCLDCNELVPDGIVRHPDCQTLRLRALGLVAS